jgi:hypothetical protein
VVEGTSLLTRRTSDSTEGSNPSPSAKTKGENMNKRLMFLGLFTLPFIGAAKAASSRNTVTWQVPSGVNKIRVRSWNPDGSKDMDRVLSVEPNQTFRIDVVN